MTVEMTESEVAVTRVLDAHWSAVKEKDVDAVIALVTDDFLTCGTDSKEFWNKRDMYNTVKQMFANTELKIDISIDKREIRIGRDGNSAIALEQMFMKPFSQKIPVRTVYHLVKDHDTWLIDFTSTAFIPINEDIDKLNKALELNLTNPGTKQDRNPSFFDHFRRRSGKHNIFQETTRIGLEPSNLTLET